MALRRRPGRRVSVIGVLLAALVLADEPAAGPGSVYVEAALQRVAQLEAGPAAPGWSASRDEALVALELAGADVVPGLVAGLAERRGTGGAAAWAWALGRACEPMDAPPSAAIDALVAALDDPGWDVRLVAASTLGSLEIEQAAPVIAALLDDPGRPAFADAPLQLALAGCGTAEADEALARRLARGGSEGWSNGTTAALLRRGASAWPLAVDALGSGDETVRGTAATVLLLLAEPASACAVMERVGSEPSPRLRRVLLQALAASAHPAAHDYLALAARHDPDPSVRRAAELLAAPPDVRAGERTTSRELRSALEQLARSRQPRGVLDDVEQSAAAVDLPAIERTLRRLPLRADAEWMGDHARLAQVRARLLCAAHPECEPLRSRVGRVPLEPEPPFPG